MPEKPPRYVHAAGHAALTRFYDPMMAATMREDLWRPALIREIASALPNGGSVIDIGCGTGSLTVEIAAARPDASVTGVDGDPETLAIARRKPGAGRVTWLEGMAGEIPLEDGVANAVVMTLLLHHLRPDFKRSALRDVHRLLRPGGQLHIADWGKPGDLITRTGFMVLQRIDGVENTRDHGEGRLSSFVSDAGFDNVVSGDPIRTMWGSLDLISASR